MNIYLKELKDYRKSLIFWSLGVIAFLLAAMGKYQGYSRSGATLTDLIDSLPAGLNAALGFKGLDLLSAGGFFALSVVYLSVMLGVHALLMGSGIIAKEETERTIEFLFAKPVSRKRILFAKLLAALTEIAILNIVTLVSSILAMAAFNDGPSINGDIVFMMPAVFFIQLWFLMIGASFAAVMRKPKRAGMVSASVLLVTYIISALVDITDRFSFLRYLTPFKYFDAKQIFIEDRYDYWYIAITAVAISIMLAGSEFAYRNRDFDV
jgi:ABC-2 type transport system permease protein